jgi:hypothetical protein
MSDQILVTDEMAMECFNSNTLDNVLDKIEKNALNFVGDSTTETGRKQIVSKAMEVTKAKTTIDKIRKLMNEERNRKTKAVNADGKRAWARLEEVQKKVRQPVTDYELAEKKILEEKRVQAEYELELEEAHAMNDLFNREKAVVEKERIQQEKEVERQHIIDQERVREEWVANQGRIEKEANERAVKSAAKSIADAKQAVIEAEVARVSAVAKAKWAKIDAENAKIEAEGKARQATIDAVEKAKKDAEDAEVKRIAAAEKKEAEEKIITDRKAANLNHQRKINREILGDMEALGFDIEISKLFISAINTKKIRNLKILY